MKRTGIGIALLVVLLAASLLTARGMARCHAPIADALKQAQLAAMEGDWPRAREAAEDARQRWQQHRKLTAVFADHGPMEEIDSLFAELEVYAAARAQGDFAAACAGLSRKVAAMGEAHAPAWWNIL